MAADPPLLPISVPVTGKITIRTLSPINRTIPPMTAVVIHAIAFITFSVSSVSTAVWAVYGSPGFSTYQSPTSYAPPCVWPGLVWAVVGFYTWLLYLHFIRSDTSGGPWLQRRLVILLSVFFKLVLALAHVFLWYIFKTVYLGAHPSPLLLFITFQASFDLFLVVIYAFLRDYD
ncbi:hypothetical protein BJX62DRAFT_238955 [Aspergillus germanicus]